MANWIKKLGIGLLSAVTFASPALAEGFAINDLTQLQVPRQIGGKTFQSRAAPERLTLACTDCDGFVAVDVLLGRSTDGTEGRFRSGETTLQTMEDICRSRDDACRLSRLDVSGAVGWISIYSSGSTAILFKDGDTLTVRGIGGTPEDVNRNVRAVLNAVAQTIIGR